MISSASTARPKGDEQTRLIEARFKDKSERSEEEHALIEKHGELPNRVRDISPLESMAH